MPPLEKQDALKLVGLRHAEWAEFQRRHRFLQDSLEGGDRYRYANYVNDPIAVGTDSPTLWFQGNSTGLGGAATIDPVTSVPRRNWYGVLADMNLIPHVSETTDDGSAVYAMRLARTAVPTIVSRAIRKHLSRIFSNEVQRTAPKAIEEWWENVDGSEPAMSIDKWVRKVVGPLLLVLGQLDLVFDHPPLPDDVDPASIRSKADMAKYGIGGCVVSYVLPENMVWWRLDRRTRRYAECLVFERCHGGVMFRHWTATESNAYTPKGEHLPDYSREHPYGTVPIVRVFDDRKPRCENVGQSRYESVAELQRAIYNKKSELELGDVLASHATLQGPEDYLTPDGGVAIGPRSILPMKKGPDGNSYSGWSYVESPKGAQSEVRLHIQDDSDDADREACLLKPAGMTSSGTVGQSGISKMADQQEGNDYLSELAETLADAELIAARMALIVLTDGKVKPADEDGIAVVYQKQFDLYTLDDLMAFLADLQAVTTAGGHLPLIEAEAVKRAIRVAFPGITDKQIAEFEAEVDDFFAAKADDRAAMSEMRAMPPVPPEPNDPESPDGSTPGEPADDPGTGVTSVRP